MAARLANLGRQLDAGLITVEEYRALVDVILDDFAADTSSLHDDLVEAGVL